MTLRLFFVIMQIMNKPTKRFTLQQPYLILIVGIPGAGKTFFARQFSDMFSAPFININSIRHQFFAEPSYDREEDNLIADALKPIIEEIMKTNQTILVEGGLDARVDRQAYARLAKKHGYRLLTVWVQNVATTARTRSTRGTPERKTELMSAESFQKILARFTAPNQAEQPVVISGKHTFSTQLRNVLRRIAETRDQQPLPAAGTEPKTGSRLLIQ